MARAKRYREQEFSFDSNAELLIYKNLCGSIKRKDKRKIEKNKVYKTYAEWQQSIIDRYGGASNEQLQEFYKYLKNRKRTISGFNSWWYTFAIPFTVTMLGAITIAYGENQAKIETTMNFNQIIENFLQLQWLDKLFVIALIVLNIILSLLPAALIIAPILVSIYIILKMSIENEQERGFYEDYMEVIDGIRAKKNWRQEISPCHPHFVLHSME